MFLVYCLFFEETTEQLMHCRHVMKSGRMVGNSKTAARLKAET